MSNPGGVPRRGSCNPGTIQDLESRSLYLIVHNHLKAIYVNSNPSHQAQNDQFSCAVVENVWHTRADRSQLPLDAESFGPIGSLLPESRNEPGTTARAPQAPTRSFAEIPEVLSFKNFAGQHPGFASAAIEIFQTYIPL